MLRIIIIIILTVAVVTLLPRFLFLPKTKTLSNLFYLSPFCVVPAPFLPVERDLSFASTSLFWIFHFWIFLFWIFQFWFSFRLWGSYSLSTVEYFIAVRQGSGGFEIHQKSNVTSDLWLSKTFPSHIWQDGEEILNWLSNEKLLLIALCFSRLSSRYFCGLRIAIKVV